MLGRRGGAGAVGIDRRPDGTAGVGTVARSGITADQIEDLVREAEKAAADADPLTRDPMIARRVHRQVGAALGKIHEHQVAIR